MEKVSLYVKKILALILASFVFVLLVQYLGADGLLYRVLLAAGSCLLFANLDFRITGDKPRFLFGMNQSDNHLNKKGGFWNLFKWIVNLFGFLYDLAVWSVWGVYLIFVLFVDLLLLIKTIIFWIIHAIIWFIRQLFPPFVFLFKMFMHYIVNWFWWIYQLTFRNMKLSVNKNFFFISLWGIIPALFIVFLFYAISQLAGMPELVAISVVFALIPLVWSFGEISALRFREREKEDYSSVQLSFGNGFEAVKSVLFYMLIIIVLILAELVLNLLGWIPNLSMSFFGIGLNLNMAISLLLVFLAIIIVFTGAIVPTHILHKPEFEVNLNNSLGLLKTIGRKFLRYTVAIVPGSLFGGLLLIIPIIVMYTTFGITDGVKDAVLDVKVEKLQSKVNTMGALDAYRVEANIQRLEAYKDIPLLAPQYFEDLRGASVRLSKLKAEKVSAEELLQTRTATFEKSLSDLNARISLAKDSDSDEIDVDQINSLTASRLDIEEEHLSWANNQKECIAFLGVDINELKSKLIQMPILYFFIGILFAVFGGLVLAVFVSYLGNVNYELYSFREDDKASYWCRTVSDLKAKDPNQPLLGFTFLVILGFLAYFYFAGIIPG